jgi:hypothetical protein
MHGEWPKDAEVSSTQVPDTPFGNLSGFIKCRCCGDALDVGSFGAYQYLSVLADRRASTNSESPSPLAGQRQHSHAETGWARMASSRRAQQSGRGHLATINIIVVHGSRSTTASKSGIAPSTGGA